MAVPPPPPAAAAVGVSQGKMVHLERSHPALIESIKRILTGENIIANCAIRDFDGAEFFVLLVDEGATVQVSIQHSIPLAYYQTQKLVANVKATLERHFTPFASLGCRIVDPPASPDFLATIAIATAPFLEDPTASVPSSAMLQEVAALRTIGAAPCFLQAFETILLVPQGGGGHQGSTSTNAKGIANTAGPTTSSSHFRIPYRAAASGAPPGSRDECFFIYAAQGNYFVSLNLHVPDSDDRLFAKAFLAAFMDARKLDKAVQSAPSFLFTQEQAPPSLRHLPYPEATAAASPTTMWVTFGLSRKNMEPLAKALVTIQHLMNFRAYLFYHIQTCRSFMHTKMRERMTLSLQVLNRAKTKATGKARVQIE